MAGKFEVDGGLIRQLAELLDETGLTEIEIGTGNRHVRVARTPDRSPAMVAQEGLVAPATPATGAPASAQDNADGQPPAGAVTSPMVGTVYVAAEPGAAPFVTIGSMVAEGDTLFIIEAMKTMNPVRAPRSGKIGDILVNNGTPVEYGETLAILS